MILIQFSAITFGLFIFFTQYSLTLTALDSDHRTDWSLVNISLSESVYVVLACQIINPTWYLKSIIAVSFYLGMLVAHIKAGHSALVWIIFRHLTSLLFTIALLVFQSKSQMRLFQKTVALEEFNQVYKNILDKNPSCMAVINTKGKLVYSNKGFQHLVKDNIDEFFKSVTTLKLRDTLGNKNALYMGFRKIKPSKLHKSSKPCKPNFV